VSKPRRVFTEHVLQVVGDRYADEDTQQIADDLGLSKAQVFHVAAKLGVRKTPEYLAALEIRQRVQFIDGSKSTRFQPGQAPWNKGVPFSAGGRSKETRFKPGQRPHTWRQIGTERLSKEGYLQRKVADTGYSPRDYKAVHHLVWIEAGREIPPGHVLIFIDGDKRNITLDNLRLITKAENMARNTIHNLPREYVEVAQLRGSLRRILANRQAKDNQHDDQK